MRLKSFWALLLGVMGSCWCSEPGMLFIALKATPEKKIFVDGVKFCPKAHVECTLNIRDDSISSLQGKFLTGTAQIAVQPFRHTVTLLDLFLRRDPEASVCKLSFTRDADSTFVVTPTGCDDFVIESPKNNQVIISPK